jgi:hypothetical protein
MEMYLKSRGLPAVLGGAMISMGRLLEKPGPALYSPECVKEEFCKLRPNGVLRSSDDVLPPH